MLLPSRHQPEGSGLSWRTRYPPLSPPEAPAVTDPAASDGTDDRQQANAVQGQASVNENYKDRLTPYVQLTRNSDKYIENTSSNISVVSEINRVTKAETHYINDSISNERNTCEHSVVLSSGGNAQKSESLVYNSRDIPTLSFTEITSADSKRRNCSRDRRCADVRSANNIRSSETETNNIRSSDTDTNEYTDHYKAA